MFGLRIKFGLAKYQLTIDNEQLTILFVLWDNSFFILFGKNFPNCQLSIVNCQLDKPVPLEEFSCF